MSIYHPLSEALGIPYEPSDSSTSHSHKPFDPFYMGNRGVFNAFYGKKHTEETKQIIREKRKLQKSSGWKHTEATKKRMSESRLGRKHTEEHKKKISEKMKKRHYHKVECPHCKTIGHYAAMGRWHFDNCKEKRT